MEESSEAVVPVPSSSDYPYVHVGHGVSTARKSWDMLVVLREPLAGEVPDGVPVPLAIDAERGSRTLTLSHEDDSLQWVVAAAYPGAGLRAEHGEATDEQWEAFNADLDEFLARLHERAPIAVAIRPIDGEYSTGLSPWHEWSCRELPPFLPFLEQELFSGDPYDNFEVFSDDGDGDFDPDDVSGAMMESGYYLTCACDMWKETVGQWPVDEQEAAIAALPAGVREIFTRFGGVPEVVHPEVERPAPSADEMLRALAAIPPDADVWEAFASEGERIGADKDDWDLSAVRNALAADPDPQRDQQLIDLCERAIASPSCRWPSTHWRPVLVGAYLRAGQIDEARREIVPVVANAKSYQSQSWAAILAYLAAVGRTDDADAVYAAAARYVVYFDQEMRYQGLDRKVPKKIKKVKDRAAQVLLDLTAPLFASLDAVDDETLNNVAFLFEDMVEDGAVGDAVLPAAGRARAEQKARRQRQEAEARRWLAEGEPSGSIDPTGLEHLLTDDPASLTVAQAERLAQAASAHFELCSRLVGLAVQGQGSNMPVALAVYRAMMKAPPPPGGVHRQNWMIAANNALITTHAERLFTESAELADHVVQYARENPYITHSAACSYAAVGRYDDALEQVRLAVELDYDHLDRLRVDTDLGPLLARDDFTALFTGPADAASPSRAMKDEIKTVWGVDELPVELDGLIDFQEERSAWECYSEGFGVGADDKSLFALWSDAESFLAPLSCRASQR